MGKSKFHVFAEYLRI